MEKRVELFVNQSVVELKNSINDFLKNNDGKVHDIKFQHNEDYDYETFSCLLIYTPEEEDEKRREGKEKDQKGNGRVQGRVTPLWEQGRPSCC